MLEEWIRDFTAKKEDKNERLAWWGKKGKYVLVMVICLGILALLWPNSKPQSSGIATKTGTTKATNSADVKSRMTTELENILASVEGAGMVKVNLTLRSDGLKNYAANTREERQDSEEKDNKGTEKKTSQQNVTRDLTVSGGSPILVEQEYPEVLGVLVVADGARNAVIKEELIEAVSTLLNLPPDKVTVLPRGTVKEE